MNSHQDIIQSTDEQKNNKQFLPASKHLNLFNIKSNITSQSANKLKIADKGSSTYFLKQHSREALAQLESYSGSIYRFLATPDYVPSVHSYHDDERILGTASKEINFVSNHDVPLLEENTIINSFNIEREGLIRALHKQIFDLCAYYQDKYRFVVSTKSNAYYSLFSEHSSAYGMWRFFIPFRDQSIELIEAQINVIASKTLARIDYINHLSSTRKESHEIELAFLNTIVTNFHEMQTMLFEPKSKISIEELEEFDQAQRKENGFEVIDTSLIGPKGITPRDLYNYRLLKGIAITQTARFIYKDYDNNNQNMAKDGKIVDFDWSKSTISYELHDPNGFGHIISIAKDYLFIADQYNLQFLPDIKSSLNYYWPTKQPETHKIMFELIKIIFEHLHEKDIVDFPEFAKQLADFVVNLRKQLNQYYETNASSYNLIIYYINHFLISCEAFLAGKTTEQIQLLKQSQELVGICQAVITLLYNQRLPEIESFERDLHQAYDNQKGNKNTFTHEDNKVFKSLATHPVVVFHKYKTLLKYILVDEYLYKALAKLHVEENIRVTSPKRTNDFMHKLLPQDESVRIKEITEKLLSMEDFKDFMTKHGEFAYQLIKDEVASYREKYVKKLTKKPHYKPLVQALDEETLEMNFQLLCNRLGMNSIKKTCQMTT